MAMTLAQAKVIAIQHCNEYSNAGELIETTDPNYQDLVLRMNPLANSAQMELAKVTKIPGTMSISQNPTTNLLGLYAFDEVQCYPGTEYVYAGTGAKSFSIEVDGDCTINFDEYVSGTWTALSGSYSLDGGTATSFSGSISVTGLSSTTLQEFKNYRGLLTSASNQVRMKITPTYPMKTRYRALFAYSYPTAIKVPHYMAYISYDLPSDYMDMNIVMRAYDQRQYEENKDYKLTNDKKLHLNWFLTGQIDIHYWKYPTEITASTADTYTFEVPLDAQSAIPWYLGGYAIYPTNQQLGNRLINQYYAIVNNLVTPATNTATEVKSGLWATDYSGVKLTNQLRRFTP